jgi:transcription elongation factor Elf1
MLLMHKQPVLSIEDFRYVSIHCVHCNSTLTIDLEGEVVGRRAYFAPIACSVCGHDFDSAVQNLNLFNQVYKKLGAVKNVLTFSGEAENEDEMAGNHRDLRSTQL